MIGRHGRLIAALVAALAAGTGLHASPGDDEREVTTFTIPLDDGALPLGALVERIAEEAGIDLGSVLPGAEWRIPVVAGEGPRRVASIEQISDGVVRVTVDRDEMHVEVDRRRLARKQASLDEAMRRWAADLQSWWIESESPDFGLHRLDPIDGGRAPERLVVLVHGLDDPPWVWRDLVPPLLERKYAVARFRYPSGGPIERSAARLDEQLVAARAAGTQRVDVIAHSMGGLVVRELLTSPAHYDGDGLGGDERPAIDRLVLVGTPNQGAPLVRMRLFGDGKLREAMTGRDGPGPSSAVVDLLPGSAFLERLNARPNAAHTRHTVLAGRISPLTEREAAAILAQGTLLARSEMAPDWLRRLASELDVGEGARVVRDAVRGAGDGIVGLDAAMLDGATDVVVVEANHMSMLVRSMPTDPETPPAIPVILERLGRE